MDACRYFFGQDYMEIVLDIHSWAYLARRAFASYVPKLGTVVFENAFVVQVRASFLLCPLCHISVQHRLSRACPEVILPTVPAAMVDRPCQLLHGGDAHVYRVTAMRSCQNWCLPAHVSRVWTLARSVAAAAHLMKGS